MARTAISGEVWTFYFLFQESYSVKGNDKSDKDTHNDEDTEHTEAHVLEGLKKGLKIPGKFEHIKYRLSN